MRSSLSPARSDQQFARAIDKQIAGLPPAPALRPGQPWPAEQPSRRKRAVRSLIIFAMGVAAALAWLSYGEAAREMLASSYPQLGWLAPQTAAAQTADAETAPETASQAATASSEPEDLKSILDNLSAVRESVDQLAAQIAASQQKMASDIAELKAAEQSVFDKINSAPPPRPAAPARRPVSAAAAPTPQPAAR